MEMKTLRMRMTGALAAMFVGAMMLALPGRAQAPAGSATRWECQTFSKRVRGEFMDTELVGMVISWFRLEVVGLERGFELWALSCELS